VRVEVVAQEDRRVAVGGGEEPRPAVVEEIALVDGLEPEGEPAVAERGEHGDELTLVPGQKGPEPEGTLPLGLLRDRVEEPHPGPSGILL
jgi:hypothetical protein